MIDVRTDGQTDVSAEIVIYLDGNFHKEKSQKRWKTNFKRFNISVNIVQKYDLSQHAKMDVNKKEFSKQMAIQTS